MAMSIPVYSLYGEQVEPEWYDFVNIEPLEIRSKIHNWEIPPHIHKTLLQIPFLRQGSVHITFNNNRLIAHAPSLIFVPAGTVHSYRYTPDAYGPSITASQRPVESMITTVMPDLLSWVRKPTVVPISPTEETEILGIYETLQCELQKKEFGHLVYCMAQLVRLFVLMARINGQSHTHLAGTMHTKNAMLVDKFMTLVDKKFMTQACVGDYAHELGITAGHLSRACREVLGISVLEFVRMRVIQEAQRELVYTSKSIKQLAAMLGYTDEAYFSRAFKKQVGLSPKLFRENALKQMKRI